MIQKLMDALSKTGKKKKNQFCIQIKGNKKKVKVVGFAFKTVNSFLAIFFLPIGSVRKEC